MPFDCMTQRVWTEEMAVMATFSMLQYYWLSSGWRSGLKLKDTNGIDAHRVYIMYTVINKVYLWFQTLNYMVLFQHE